MGGLTTGGGGPGGGSTAAGVGEATGVRVKGDNRGFIHDGRSGA